MRAGDESASNGQWDEAFSYYQQGYNLDSTSFEMLGKYADAARIVKYYALAERLYERSYQKDNGKLNPDALYYLAWMQKFNGRYEDAQRNFKKYVKKYKSKGDKNLIKRAEQEAKSAVWALNYKTPANVPSLVVMNKEINSGASEIAPFYKEQFYFSSSREIAKQHKWQLYTVKDEGIKNIAINGFDAGGEIANLFISNERAFFTVKISDITLLYEATFEDGSLSKAQPIKELNKEGTINTMPFLFVEGDQTILYFSSNREDGEGGMDIWMSQWNGNSFENPTNPGNRVNTLGDELTPFVKDGFLYFASDWHEGFGGHDIFKCAITNAGYNKIENLGIPFNSSANDLYYFNDGESKKIWLSSNREVLNPDNENPTCCNDLYEISILEDEIVSTEENKNKMDLADLMATVPVTLYFHNDEPNPDVWVTTTTLSYMDAYDSYFKLLPTYLKENTKGLSGEKMEEAEQITQDFFDLKVKKGVDDLNLFSELLLKELEEGQSLRIYVRGFASPRAKSDYNLNLTKRRTSSLVNFLKADRGGAFLPYINDSATNGARLEFQLIPFGEVKADKSVSDDLIDEKNSIYVRSACLERKIEIENIVLIPNTVKEPQFRMEESGFDFGKINPNDIVKHTFLISNDGNAPMYIDSLVADCGCTEPKMKTNVILPGQSAEMEVGFDPFGKKGKDSKTVTIYIQGEEPRQIVIQAEIVRP